MPETEMFQVLIVGGGKAGKTLAADLGRGGHNVALVERGRIGGTCINVGCIPTKALVKSAKVADLARRGGTFGIEINGPKANIDGILAYKRSVVAGMVDLNWNTLHAALGVNFILGEARFVAPRTVEVRPTAGGPVRRLCGEKVFINLGAAPRVPSIPGMAECFPLTSDSALELDHLPDHLLIMGGGYIGVELGQAFCRFGSAVTIVQRASHLLPNEDSDISEAVEAILREDGIGIVTHAEVIAAAGRSGEAVELRIRDLSGERTLHGSDLLVAVGRVPSTADVGLSTADVDIDPDGFIRVNDRLETTTPMTWALGDCAGSPQQTHVALDDYRIVRANVFGNGGRSTADRPVQERHQL